MHKDGSLSGIEYVHLMKEFSSLEGGRINKVYQDDTLFFFPVYTGSLRTNLLIDLGKVAYFTDNKPVFPARPGGFCMFLRKRLGGSRINRVCQRGSERILEFFVSTKDAEYILLFEMFGKGNCIVCTPEYKIISAFEYVSYADRVIRGGAIYTFPAPMPDIQTIEEKDFVQFFSSQDNAQQVLAKELGLGREYADLILLHATDQSPSSIYASLQKLIHTTAAQYSSEYAYPVSVLSDAKSVDSFSLALSSLLDPLRVVQKKEEHASSSQKVADKFSRIIDAQQKQVARLEESIAVSTRAGEIIYEHYQKIELLLEQARKDRKLLSEKEFIAKYTSYPYVVSASLQELVIEVPDE